MTTLTVKVEPTVARDIAREAKRRKVSKSEIIRERLAPVKPAGKVSLWERMKDLVIDDPKSPGDLSTNPKHMAGYGRNRPRR